MLQEAQNIKKSGPKKNTKLEIIKKLFLIDYIFVYEERFG